MNSRAFRRLAASAAALGGLLLTATPAHAALMSPQADAYALSVNALGSNLVAPTPRSMFPNGGTASLLDLNAGIAEASALNATTAGDPTAGTSSASSSVAKVSVNLGPTASLDLSAVDATCTATPDGATGSSDIATAVVNSLLSGLVPPANIPVNASPNTAIELPGLAKVVLNEQSTDADGVLTVNAVHITLLSGKLADIVIAHAQCGGAPPIQAVPMISPSVGTGAGAAALATTGGVVYLRRRRSNAQLSAG